MNQTIEGLMDWGHYETRNDSILSADDRTEIATELIRVPEGEFIAEMIATPEYNLEPDASTYRTKWFNARGSAEVVRAGSLVTDIPSGDLYGGHVDSEPYYIVQAMDLSRDEISRWKKKRNAGLPYEELNLAETKNSINKTSNKIFFLGHSKYGIYGLANHPGIPSDFVSEGATGATTAERRLWANKTLQEKLVDLKIQYAECKQGQLWEPDTFLGSSKLESELTFEIVPDSGGKTALTWLKLNLPKIKKWHFIDEFSAGNNGDSVDYMAMGESSKKVMDIGVPIPMRVGETKTDLIGNTRTAVFMKTVGMRLRHATAWSIKKGI